MEKRSKKIPAKIGKEKEEEVKELRKTQIRVRLGKEKIREGKKET